MPQSYAGLTQQEAKNQLEKYGLNQIRESNKTSPLRILLRQVKNNFIIYLLAVSSVISYAVGKIETTYALIAVVIVVVVFGFIQEYKAEKATEALRNMLTQFSTVVRDGKEQEVESAHLVPDDILILRNGEKVPADCTVLEQKALLLNESILTGESKEIEKKEGEEIFMGSFVVGGHCTARVVRTAMWTKFGKIASLISGAEKELTLQKKINAIGKYTVMVGLIMAIATGTLMFVRNPSLEWENVTGILILVMALSVSTFPEGLPVVLTTTLAVGAGRMAKQNAIVNRMGVIETLGEVTVICSDKTGTITTGQMTIKQVFCGSNIYDVEGVGYNLDGKIVQRQDGRRDVPASDGSAEFDRLIKCAVICNDAKIEATEENAGVKITGSPTEGALLILAGKAGVYKEDVDNNRLEEIPFSSERKLMSVVVENTQAKHPEGFLVYSKGAPEVILAKSSLLAKDGREVPLTESNKGIVRILANEMSRQSYRTLALAYKKVETGGLLGCEKSSLEDNLVFLGLLAMEDPPREEIKSAIQTAEIAGIKVKMITGDNIETAISVGKKIGLEGRALEGIEMDDLSKEDLLKIVDDIVIFARVRPDHKIRIVKALKEKGHIVAMTGDGVNDAPALKESHVGIAMGKNGTDVSRATADITLKDDNFATIISAIKEGRGVFNNIQKFVSYQLSCNLAELLVLFFGVLLAPTFGWQVPIITALQILFMNLVTDSLPAITLGFNPTSPDIMLAQPRASSGIINRFTISTLVFAGLVMGGFTLFANYFSFNFWGHDAHIAATTTLIALICLEIVTAFTFRSFRKLTLSRSPLVNRPLVFASLASLLATLLIVYTPFNSFFETTAVGVKSWLLVLGLCLLVTVIYDLAKLLKPQTQHA
ncbi:cation-transporting P-type ATPase [Patescibacteria group bacterium]|nr:cation-transporting P-type ATPase [Patescibacteria group bacterium]MBU1970412.1 cation-transporting P-type ATPase [Patescibacteria group bacterium]